MALKTVDLILENHEPVGNDLNFLNIFVDYPNNSHVNTATLGLLIIKHLAIVRCVVINTFGCPIFRSCLTR